ncbi:uncharacterized protein LOC111592019 [Drosophila hydei]|uniref:Uncharacterized protein LOC111592019 n=1 Tax=Drosophila hydei TaxID=7224 RepID=A0A6J1L993_DROHY|nr:uncharacterized protein LOC111592019 [Drosophila hydei]
MKAVTFAVLIVCLLVVLVAAQPQRFHHNGAIQQHKSPYEGGDDQQHMGRPESDEGSNERPYKRHGHEQRRPYDHELGPFQGQGPSHDQNPQHKHRPSNGHHRTPPPQKDESTTFEPEESTTVESEESTTVVPEESTTLAPVEGTTQ